MWPFSTLKLAHSPYIDFVLFIEGLRVCSKCPRWRPPISGLLSRLFLIKRASRPQMRYIGKILRWLIKIYLIYHILFFRAACSPKRYDLRTISLTWAIINCLGYSFSIERNPCWKVGSRLLRIYLLMYSDPGFWEDGGRDLVRNSMPRCRVNNE